MRYAFFLLILYCQTTLGQNIFRIEVDQDHAYTDETNKIVLCQMNLDAYQYIPDSMFVQLEHGEDSYQLVGKPSELNYRNSYVAKKDSMSYRLFFTQLPIVSIESDSRIIDASKVVANFKYVDDTRVLVSSTGIELRGGTSVSYPKKTYDLELRDGSGESRDAQFVNLREDDDWILDALYNEPLRIRSFMSHKLWLRIHTPTYQDKEPKAKAGADVMWVEVFLQGAYQGIYLLSEQVDRKLLKLKKFEGGNIRGELFKGAKWGDGILFKRVPPYDTTSRQWDGYELKYPGQEDTTDWASLHDFVDFVLTEDSLTFNETVSDRFDMLNAVDYFIFLNVLWADDNRGKNIYVARYDEKTPYFYVPWDLDATWGNIYTGAAHNTINRILSNGFYHRLIKQNSTFNALLTQRWYELRREVLSDESVAKLIDETYTALTDYNIYEREQLVWKGYKHDTASVSYLKSWTTGRLAYLDRRFYDPVLNTKEDKEEEKIVLYPNPAKSSFQVTLSHNRSVTYQLIDTYGSVVRSGKLYPGKRMVSVTGLRKGHYVFRAEGITRRVLVID